MQTRRAAIALILIFVFSHSLLFTVSATNKSTQAPASTTIFHSDDVEKGAGRPAFLKPYLIEVVADSKTGNFLFDMPEDEFSILEYARRSDFYYTYARPSIVVGQNSDTVDVLDLKYVTAEEIANLERLRTLPGRQIKRMGKIEDTSKKKSKWSSRQSDFKSDGVIQDAHIEIIGITGSPKVNLANQDDVYLLDGKGRVLTYADYRVEKPDQDCTEPNTFTIEVDEEVGGKEVEKEFQNYSYRYCTKQIDIQFPGDTAASRSVSIGGEDGQTWRGTFSFQNPLKVLSQPRAIGYDTSTTDLGPGVTTLQAKSTIRVRVVEVKTLQIEAEEKWIPHTQLELEFEIPVDTTIRNDWTDKVTVTSEKKTVAVSEQNQLEVTQRVITRDGEPSRLVLEMDGPRRFTERRLWQTLMLDTYTIVNGWGVYSYRTGGRGGFSTKHVNRRSQFQPRLALEMTARSSDLRIRPRIYPGVEKDWEEINPLKNSVPPRIRSTSKFNFNEESAQLPANVDLSTSSAVGYDRIVLQTNGETVKTVRDIHGNRIQNVETVRHEWHSVSLDGESINDTHATFTLIDETAGEPLAGKPLVLENANRERAITSPDGTVVVEHDGQFVSATFKGSTYDDLEGGTADSDQKPSVYYSLAEARVMVASPVNLVQIVNSIFGALATVSAFVLFYAPVWYLKNRQ